ncbi:hypothetical protein GX51_00930 [Blastomyces parvus]|uniref:Uncharacterized protein n=1 Tax=Blastomyces parvus TaxID=2060905 RepID=A0A2B7XJ86_9EURO|nr:hypothetical protein GX51_00930 [Blastomyces parvus]
MGVLTPLCQLLLLGLASAQVVKDPLMKTVEDLSPKFVPILPAPQKYTYTKWAADDIDRGLPHPDIWGDSAYDPNSRHYCGEGFSVYNVTYADCPEPWLIGHCADATMSKEDTFDLLGRLPSSARGVISDFLHTVIPPSRSLRGNNDHSAYMAGPFQPSDSMKIMLTATWIGSPGIPQDEFAKAVAADTCVADEKSAAQLKQGRYGGALEGGFTVAAYMKLVKTPPLDTSCMSNQLAYLKPFLDKRWDAPGQCPNKVAPRLEKDYKRVLFSNGIEVLNTDPVPGSEAKVTQWKKSDGYPRFCWNEARATSDDGTTPWCEPDSLEVYSVSYPDCPDQDPWVLCRCSNAQQTLDQMVTRFGRLPAGLRSYITHLIAFKRAAVGGAAISPGNLVIVYGEAQDSVYMHEATHHIDRRFSVSEGFKKAKEMDTCFPTAYSKRSDVELFAEIGVLYLYDKSGKTLLERGYDASCLKNELDALGGYVGKEYIRDTSKCFKRVPDSPIIHPTDAGILNAEPYISEAVIETFSNDDDDGLVWAQEIDLS